MRILLIACVAVLGYLLFWPVPVDPVRYTPPPAPQPGRDYTENNLLAAAEFVALPEGAVGPEDLAVMPDGAVYTADLGGVLYRIDGETPVEIDRLGGRPLGLRAGPDGALYIADSFRGVMRWTGPGTLEPVLGEIDGAPMVYANQLDLAPDGTLYVSNSTDRFDPQTMGGTKPTSVMTIWEQSETGYVVRRDPDGKVEKLTDGLVYANGVALSPDADFLLIAETGRARVHRLWLTGDRSGQREILLDNLPGYPDNLEAQGDGTYWLAFASPRVPAEALMPYPFLRKVIWRLGPMVRPAPVARGMLVQIDDTGRILRMVQDLDGRLGITTGGRIVGDYLYIMTLDSPGFARLPVDKLPPIR